MKNPFRYTPVIRAPKEAVLTSDQGKIHKIVPPHLEEVFFAALKGYPELKDTYLVVVETRFYGIQHALRSYPPLLSLLNKNENRVYPIVINTKKGIPNSFYTLTTDEQIGSLAHELAHTLDYSKQSSLQLVGFSLNWLTKSFVRKLEHAIDSTAIIRGYGEQLLSFREKVIGISTPKMRAHIKSMYLSPEEIVSLSKESHFIIRNPLPQKTINEEFGKPIPSVVYSVITAVSFIPEITQMIYLIWIRRMHTKPNWYTK